MPDNVKCPSCAAWNPAEAMTVRGDVKLTDEYGRWRYVEGVYPVTTGGYPRLAIIQCGGCNTEFAAIIAPQKDRRAVWPLPGTDIPSDLPPKIGAAFRDAKLALAAGSLIGALMAGRTVLIRMLRDKKAANFKELVDKHIVTPALYGGADQLRLWADIIGHDDVETEDFSEPEVSGVIEYLGTILEAVYSHQAKVNRFVARTKELKDKTRNN